MAEEILMAARRTTALINRRAELDAIAEAIYTPTASTEVVLIQGAGGMGKSRLLEEALWRGGNPFVRGAAQMGPMPADRPDLDWTRRGQAAVSDIIDLANIRLHSRNEFMRHVSESLTWAGADFSDFDDAYWYVQRLRTFEAGVPSIRRSAEEAARRFVENYQANAQRRRLVIVLDTAEQLVNLSSDWLRQRNLLEPEDMAFNTQRWLADRIRAGDLPNTTLIIAGRPWEGRQFFADLEAATQACSDCHLTSLTLGPLSLEDTQEYFQALAADWTYEAVGQPVSSVTAALADSIRALAEDEERLAVLHHYTDGQPVRLALYTDLIIEGRPLPGLLGDSLYEARQRDRAAARGEIEREFVNLLFAQSTERSEIMKAMARAPRGLTVDQLHFVLDSPPGSRVEEWRPDQRRREDLTRLLADLQRLTIVKRRPDGRIGLQDEVYHIYARRRADRPDTRADEMRDRRLLYARLRAWARREYAALEAQHRAILDAEERALPDLRPSEALKILFPGLSPEQATRRIWLRDRIRELQLEEMHFALLRDPRAINDAYFDLAEALWRDNDEDTDTRVQAEMVKALYDEDALLFVDLEPREAELRRGELPIDTLRRFAQQEDVRRWIKRFVARGDYQRAVAFSEAVEVAVERIAEPHQRRSWSHTLGRSERACWREYARIMQNDEILQAVRTLERHGAKLTRLVNTTMTEWAFEDRQEMGFKGHPAEHRLRRVIATIHNFIGYGYALLGWYGSARVSFIASLVYTRQAGPGLPSWEAAALDDSSRVLSAMGTGRARRICAHALDLRKQQGVEIPIALSTNTLALIDNDQGRPDLAWREAARAVAYFRRADNRRGLGLALIQMGKSLRCLANQARKGQVVVSDPPDIIYAQAAEALREALSIFHDNPETIRLIETHIELACLQRDRMDAIQRVEYPDLWRQYYRDAFKHLEDAIELAKERKLFRYELDAHVNRAWTYYFAKDAPSAVAACAEILQSVEGHAPDALLRPGQPPSAVWDETYLFFQLSKLFNLRGRLAMDRFVARAEQLKAQLAKSISEVDRDIDDVEMREERAGAVHGDAEAQGHLRAAAADYVQALGYAQLFSPRSTALVAIYDTLYDYLKAFNQVEVDDFDAYSKAARATYHADAIVVEDLGDLEQFLDESFGSSTLLARLDEAKQRVQQGRGHEFDMP